MRRRRYTVSAERRAEFEQRDGEDPYQWSARQIDMATPFEATWLFLMRDSDLKQREAWQFHRLAITALWSRRAYYAVLVGIGTQILLFGLSNIFD
jgi:hypothetical protein